MKILTILSLILVHAVSHSILDFGAIKNDTTWLAESRNAKAIENAFRAAHNKDKGDKKVVIPEGVTISSLPVHVINVTDVEFVIDGTLLISKNYEAFLEWDITHCSNETDKCLKMPQFLGFVGVEDITFRGKGEIDGQGYMWWVREVLRIDPIGRPTMIHIWKGRNIDFSGITLRNSPRYHIDFNDVENVYVHDMEIKVNVMSQF